MLDQTRERGAESGSADKAEPAWRASAILHRLSTLEIGICAAYSDSAAGAAAKLQLAYFRAALDAQTDWRLFDEAWCHVSLARTAIAALGETPRLPSWMADPTLDAPRN